MTEQDRRDEVTLPEIPDVPWAELSPSQAQFTHALLDFVHDGVQAGDDKGKPARYRVFTASDKLPRITQIAEQNRDWDVYGEGEYEAFHGGTQAQGSNITSARAGDDLLSASYAVMLCEGRFYELLGNIVKTPLWERWQEGLQGRDAEGHLAQWTRRSFQEGQRVVAPQGSR